MSSDKELGININPEMPKRNKETVFNELEQASYGSYVARVWQQRRQRVASFFGSGYDTGDVEVETSDKVTAVLMNELLGLGATVDEIDAMIKSGSERARSDALLDRI